MLPFAYEYNSLASNIVIGPAVLYALLLIYLIWIDLGKKYGDRYGDIILFGVVAVTGITNAALMIAYKGTRADLWRAAFVFYYVSFAFTWIIGTRKCYRLVATLSRNPKSVKTCRNLLNASYWMAVFLVGFAITVAILNRSTYYEIGFLTSFAARFQFLILLYLWIMVILYFSALCYTFKLATRRDKDALILFSVLNTIAAVVDTIYVCTNLTFFDSMTAGLFLFFLTDFLSVATLFIVTHVWKFNIYEKVQPEQTV